jgi:hypothetical protein
LRNPFDSPKYKQLCRDRLVESTGRAYPDSRMSAV